MGLFSGIDTSGKLEGVKNRNAVGNPEVSIGFSFLHPLFIKTKGKIITPKKYRNRSII